MLKIAQLFINILSINTLATLGNKPPELRGTCKVHTAKI